MRKYAVAVLFTGDVNNTKQPTIIKAIYKMAEFYSAKIIHYLTLAVGCNAESPGILD